MKIVRSNREADGFTRFASTAAHWSGKPATFILAGAFVVAWGLTGPMFGFSETWQLVINTSTTIVTFLMVFLIQNAQNRDTYAIQLKLDELIRVSKDAQIELLDLEELSEAELCQIRDEYEELAAAARKKNAQEEQAP